MSHLLFDIQRLLTYPNNCPRTLFPYVYAPFVLFNKENYYIIYSNTNRTFQRSIIVTKLFLNERVCSV